MGAARTVGRSARVAWTLPLMAVAACTGLALSEPTFVDDGTVDRGGGFGIGSSAGELCFSSADCLDGLRCLQNGLVQYCVRTCQVDGECPVEEHVCHEVADDPDGWCGPVTGPLSGDDSDDRRDFEPPDDGGVPAPATPGTGGDGLCGSEVEDLQLSLLNGDRVANGLPPLECDLRLAAVAREHSEDMARRGFFDHTNPDGEAPWDRMERNGITGFSVAAENIAYGHATAEDVEEGWMGSPGHRDNIMCEGCTHVGVGVADLGGTPYWTQLFAGF